MNTQATPPASDRRAPTPRKGKRGKRRALRIAVVLVLAPAIAAATLGLALRSAAVRQLILQRVGRAVDEATGIRLRAADFTLRLTRGTLDLEALTLAAGDAPPFFTAGRLRLELGWRDLVGEPRVVRAIVVERPIVDLRQPLPELRDRGGTGGGPPEILELRLIEGRVLGAAVPGGESGPWLRSWSADSVEIRGSLRGGRAALEVRQARLRLDLPAADSGPLELALTTRASGPLAGPFTLEQLSLSGRGLRLAAAGELGARPDDPLRLTFELAAEPGRWIADAGPNSRLSARGALDVRRLTGEVQVAATDFPSALFEPWIGVAARPGGEPAALDLDLRLVSDPDAVPPLTGQAELVWSTGERRLLTASATLLEGRIRGPGTVDLESLVGELRAVASDLPVELLCPWLGAPALARFGAEGTRLDLETALTVTATAPARPDGRLDLVWRRGDEQLARVSARSSARGEEEAGFDLEVAAELLPAAAGRRHLRGRIAAPSWPRIAEGRLDQTRLEIDIPDLEAALGDAHRRWPQLLAAAGLDPESMAWRPAGALALNARIAGTPRAPEVVVDARWQDGDAWSFGLTAAGRPRERRGEARLVIERAELERLPLDMTGELAGVITVSGSPRAYEARAVLDGRRIRYGSKLPPIEALRLEARTDGEHLEIATLSGLVGESRFAGHATAGLDDLPCESGLVFGIDQPWPHVDRAELAVTCTDGVLRLGRLAVDGPAGRGSAVAELALAALLGLPAIGPWLDRRGVAATRGGPAWIELELADLDLVPLLHDLGIGSSGAAMSFAGVTELRGRLALELAPPPAPGTLAPLRLLELRGEVTHPLPGIDFAEIEAVLAAGVVRLDRLTVAAPAGTGHLAAEIPLEALRVVPGLGPQIDRWSVATAGGPVTLDVDFPHLELGPLLRDLGREEVEAAHVRGLRGRLTLDPTELSAASGELSAAHWSLEIAGHRIAAGEPLRAVVADRRLELPTTTIRIDDHSLAVTAGLELAPAWRPDPAAPGPIRSFAVHAEGAFAAELLTPYLAGGIARGPIAVTAELSGTPEAWQLRLLADGPEASVLYASPYLTQLQGPHLEVVVSPDGEMRLVSARARLNDGELSISGRRSPAGDGALDIRFDDVRYVLDHGLNTVLNARMRLLLPVAGKVRLSGEIEVERGLVRRHLNLDREVLGTFFAPPDLRSARVDPLDEIELDLLLTTAEGVRVKNNLADLRASWSLIQVQGTVANPVVQGRIDLDSGGMIFAYGQTVRIDEGTITFAGDPEAPEIKFQTTSSLREPGLARADESFPGTAAAGLSEPSTTGDPRSAFLQDRLGYYGRQAVERVSDRLAGIRLQPVLVFKETDPGASLIVSRDLSSYVAFAVAIDLRDSQNRTYLLDLHRFPVAPQLAFQAFTNDAGNAGGSLQQTVLFGGFRAEDRPRLRKVFFEGVPEELSEPALRRAVGFSRGDPLGAGADFEIAIDAVEHLRQRGYPGAAVDVELKAVNSHEADLKIVVDPGPRVVFLYEGTLPPVALRRAIAGPYRVDFYEQASLEEVSAQAVRVLRSQGYLDPQVDVDVDAADGSRTVTIRSQGGRRIRLDRIVFAGPDAADATWLERRFAGEVARLELAAGQGEADEWLLRNLRSLGYPEARIASRELSESGRQLTVAIATGPRQGLAAVRVEGLDEAVAVEVLERLPIRTGDPVRSDLIAAGNLLISDHLRSRGYHEVRVETLVRPVAEGSTSLDLVYRVESGPQYRVGAVRFAGLGATHPGWARKLSGLEESSPLDPERLAQARRRLAETRLFRSVRSTTTDLAADGLAEVTFEVREEPRFRLAYGLRWESSEGAGVVLDGVDRNFLGRGVTLGLRTLWAEEDRAARLYLGRTRLFGRRLALDFFLERRRDERSPGPSTERLLVDSLESTVQLSFPIDSWTSRVYGQWRREESREEIPGGGFSPAVRLTSPVIGWQLIRDTRDDAVAPERGTLISTDLSATGEYLRSDCRFARFFGQVQVIRPLWRLGRRQLTWAHSYRVGFLDTEDEMPLLTDLFVAGGEYSLRGYPTDSLPGGPRGGEALLVINEELRFPVRGRLSGLVFFDAGNAWGAGEDFGSDLFKAVGVGLRARTPLGLVRLDVGYPLDRRAGDPQFETYLGFGHAF